MTNQSPLRCAVIGVGRMGRHHARIYSENADVEFVGAVDVDGERCRDIIEQWGGKAFSTVDDLISEGVDAVTIATPTVHHRMAAEQLLSSHVACLIEKPLAPDAIEAEAIARVATQRNAVLQVGHVVRYDPVMRAMRRIENLRPQFIEVHRVSPMTFRSVDVGVVLDMMIHDLDIILMLLGAEPQDVQANAVCVLGDHEDVCNARLTFPADTDGVRCVANVTASRLALKTERKMRIVSDDMYVSADFVQQKGTVVRKTANEEQLMSLREQLRAGADLSDVNYLDLVNVEELNVADEEPLKLEIDDFLNAVRHAQQPLVDAQAGFAAVRTAERIVNAAREAGARAI